MTAQTSPDGDMLDTIDIDELMACSHDSEALGVGEHGEQSDRALNAFAERAMRHGRRATLCLLAGGLLETLVIAGLVCLFLTKNTVIGDMLVAALKAMMVGVAITTHNRWKSHRAQMHDAIGAAMGWKSDYETMIQEHAQRDALDRYDQAREAADEQQRDALSWTVDEPPVFLDHESYAASRAASEEYVHGDAAALRAEIGDIIRVIFSRLNTDEGRSEPPKPLAVGTHEPWRVVLDRALTLPTLRTPPPPLQHRIVHQDEQRRLEKDLCRAINAHWDGAFHRLLAEGANPNGFENSGRPLRIAVLRGKIEYVGWLLALGADPNAQCHGRTVLQALITQIELFADEEGSGDGDDHEWPERVEMLTRAGANAHVRNRYFDEDDDTEGPTAWPFIKKRPVIYEAYMKGRAALDVADDDAHRLLHDMREAIALDAVSKDAEAFLNAMRGPRTA